MSQRISVTLPDDILEELEIWANTRGQTTASLASYLIQKAVEAERISTIDLPPEVSTELLHLATSQGTTPAQIASSILLEGLRKIQELDGNP